jgi:biopolymer transport protein ExbD
VPLKVAREELPALNLTPMIDVVLLLVIFFMVATQFADSESTLDLQVPTVAHAGALTAPPQRRVVNVDRAGQLFLDGKPTSDQALRTSLATARNEYPKLAVLVRGDGRGSFQRVADALSVCKSAGIANLGVSVRATETPETP